MPGASLFLWRSQTVQKNIVAILAKRWYSYIRILLPIRKENKTMSESKAKKIRKEQAPQVQPKKKDRSGLIFNIVVILVIAAVAIPGGWAAYEKIKANMPIEEEPQVQTVAQVAQEEELSVEEFLAKVGLEDAGLTAESTAEELMAKMTIENFAMFEDTEVEEFKKMYGIESLANDTLWSEAQMQIPMAKMAENQYDMSFEDFAAQNQLPPEITGDMTQAEAIEIMQQDHSGHDHSHVGHDHE